MSDQSAADAFIKQATNTTLIATGQITMDKEPALYFVITHDDVARFIDPFSVLEELFIIRGHFYFGATMPC